MKKDPFKDQLEQLLRNDAPEFIARQNARFDELRAGLGETYALFGAGRLGKMALAGLRKAGIEPVAFADNRESLWNTSLDGVQVLSPQDAVDRFAQKAIFVVTVYTSQPVWDQLSTFGVRIASFASLAWRYPSELLPHADLELPFKIFDQADDVRKAFGLWADDISRREYLGQLSWHTTLDRTLLPDHLLQQEIYFADELIAPLPEEVFVDCGAFDGDTVREFIRRRGTSFGHIVAIEPDPANCKVMQAHLAELPEEIRNRVTTMQHAVGASRGMVSFNATGTAASSVGNGTFDVECVPLDDLLQGYKPTYIKMDIEGAEPDAVSGARRVIAEDAPVLAVCLYHRQEHLWQIPLMIRSFSDQYKFFLRRYADECWELVCYAVPSSRLRT